MSATMEVKLKTGRVGNRFAQSAGDVIRVPVGDGERMIESGQAIVWPPVDPDAGAKRK